MQNYSVLFAMLNLSLEAETCNTVTYMIGVTSLAMDQWDHINTNEITLIDMGNIGKYPPRKACKNASK